MRQFCLRAALAVAICAAAAAASAQELSQVAAPTDGVQLARRESRVREIVPMAVIDQQAAREYEQVKQEAIARHTLLDDSDPQVLRLREIGVRLLPQTVLWNPRAGRWAWEINVIRADQVNAFCMPGGKMAVYTGLLNDLKLTDDEVAMVMGHEIAHALEEHARQRAAQAEISNLGANVVSQLTGFGNLGNMDIGSNAKMLSLRFSRQEETEADLIGMDIASRAGYDPRAAITLWQKMGKFLRAGDEFSSTHPSGRSRIAVLEAHMKEVLPLYARAMEMPMEKLSPYQTNMANLGGAPVDNGDDDQRKPLKLETPDDKKAGSQ
ncbi:MAG: peptidase M48 [Cupriavidus sp.]|jgi:Zn-dependent protease with chaperone function|uniref:M48 family metallopeptidase n=1 Tax=Cupriavidus pauculus TaxID=82633 RepID=UPI000C5394F3|nr:M48 family metallopeptidase [Cupriavidus pauculus]KAB0602564.1 M48 family metallopeptidase [Cupriavidus pauculus]MBU64436.1 peptidase M48 [Cupriavidus sp.]MCM3604305.1 M48 family metallopeptidase [Cupriavidus pauculus]UAK98347.1 M48 family metallopeptidase [Cupriavidus pauculus]